MARLSKQTFCVKDVEKTAQFYDKVHIHYERLGIFSENNAYVTTYGLLRDRIAALNLGSKIRNGVVLDAGCGAWQKGVRILRQFHPRRVEAVDFNSRSLAHCRHDPQENTTYSRQDLSALGFADETFDFIICEGVVHHTLDPARTVDELMRVLKTGGCLTLGVYCWRFPYSMVSFLLKKTIGRITDVSRFLALSRKSKVMLIFADFIFVPVEHRIKEKKLLEYFSSKGCNVIFNDIMDWPLPVVKSQSKLFYKLTGLLYRHIFVVKERQGGSV